MRLIFPDKEALLGDRSGESDKDGASNGGGEDDEKTRPSKKRRRKDKSGEDSGDVDKGMGGKKGGARKKLKKNHEGVGEEKSDGSYGGREEAGTGDMSDSGGVVENSRLMLTKEDFREAALLPAWKPMQPTLYSFFK